MFCVRCRRQLSPTYLKLASLIGWGLICRPYDGQADHAAVQGLESTAGRYIQQPSPSKRKDSRMLGKGMPGAIRVCKLKWVVHRLGPPPWQGCTTYSPYCVYI